MTALLVLPVILLAVLGGMQVMLWYYAKDSVLTAAQTGADVARISGGNSNGAEAAATGVASQQGVQNISVQVERGAEFVTVTVRGRPVMFVDLPLADITQTVTVPTERATTP